jgi:uncharacterized membrane protein YbhN (UPF0104 family)
MTPGHGPPAGAGLSLSSERAHLLLLDEEPGRRHKRPADALLLLVAGALAVVGALTADARDGSEPTALQSFAQLFGWFDAGWRVIYLAALAFGAAVLLEALALRRWSLVRDQLLAVAASLAAGLLIAHGIYGSWPGVREGLLSPSTKYPAFRLAAVAAILVVAAPVLTHTARLLGIGLVTLSVPALLALEIEYPSSLLGGVALGVAAASVVRLIMGSSAGFPSRGRVLAGLSELDLAVVQLKVSPRQRSGAAVFDAVDLAGRPLVVLVVGRDATDAQWVANAWRRLWLRDPGQGPAPGRIQQVEHESLMTLLAERSSVRVPEVVDVGRVSSGDAILVLADCSGPSAEEASAQELSDAFLVGLWQNVATLHDRGIAHGQLHAGNVLAVGNEPLLTNFSLARLSATPEGLQIDVAELLVSTTVLVGPERALDAALSRVEKERLVAALPYLQRAALTPHTRDRAHDHELDLNHLRNAVAMGTGVKVPEVAPLHRIRLRDIGLMLLFAFAAYLVIGQLAQVGFDTIVDQLRAASWPWVVTALVLAQTTFVAQAVALRGSVLERLPLLPCVVLQSALKFINLTVPTAGGTIAVNIRFLQKQGAPTGQAVASGAVYSAAGTLVQTVMFLLVLPFVHLEVNPSDTGGAASSDGSSSLLWLGVAVTVATVVVVAVVLLVPSLRAKVMPTVRTAWSSLGAVLRDRRRRVLVFGGKAGSQILFALTLGACCQAYGVHVSLPELLFVNTAVTVFAGILPVPGGIGVAEAGLTAGLTAVGVGPSVAFAAALTHRLCTYYLPPIWGYFSFRWLTHHGYI